MSTKIEWTETTWNPVTGCSKISTGCRNCYAERMAKRLAGRYGYLPWPYEFDVTFHEDKLYQPLSWKKPRMIFVCSMGDLFHEDVSVEIILQVFEVIAKTPRHTYQILTKRPERMQHFVKEVENACFYDWRSSFPNVWLGVTAENQQSADERIPWLLKTPAAVRFVSVEPMLGPVDLSNINGALCSWWQSGSIDCVDAGYLDWVICGGETGHGAREMKPEWAWDLLSSCRDAGVPFFFKKAGDATKYKDHYPITREYPKGVNSESV